LQISRHFRICVIGAEEGTLVWEALRQAPEGGVTGIVTRPEKLEFLQHYGEQLDPMIRPEFREENPESYTETYPGEAGTYDVVIGRNVVLRSTDRTRLLDTCFRLLSEKGRLLLAETLPARSTRLSELAAAADHPMDREQLDALAGAEEALYSDTTIPLLRIGEEELKGQAEAAGFSGTTTELRELR